MAPSPGFINPPVKPEPSDEGRPTPPASLKAAPVVKTESGPPAAPQAASPQRIGQTGQAIRAVPFSRLLSTAAVTAVGFEQLSSTEQDVLYIPTVPQIEIRGSSEQLAVGNEEGEVRRIEVQKHVNVTAKKRSTSATSTRMSDGGSRSPVVPPCHLCQKSCAVLRRAKEHYILVHYAQEFSARYTQGKKLSGSEVGQCQFCRYQGNTRDLAFHVGIFHGKLEEYLPNNVWSSMFGHQPKRFKTTQEGLPTTAVVPPNDVIPPKEAPLIIVEDQTEVGNNIAGGRRSVVVPSAETVAATGQGPNNRQSAWLQQPPQPSSSTGTPQGVNVVIHCHECNYSSVNKSGLRAHYLTHYKNQMFARFCRANSVADASSRRGSAGLLLERCTFCQFQDRPLSLIKHVWTTHSVIKEYLPEDVWQQMKPEAEKKKVQQTSKELISSGSTAQMAHSSSASAQTPHVSITITNYPPQT